MPEDPTHVAGDAFEKYVVGMFGKDFHILRWMQEGAGKEEIDFKPDLEIESVRSKEIFGVECKYRSSHYLGRLSWAKEYQLKKYDRYREKTGYRLFIIIGLGGTPEKPDYMYCIPAWQAAHTMLDADSLKRYRRDPRRKFRWDATTRMLA
jgi:hypothetical protein